MKTRDIVIGGLLTAVSIMIPLLLAGTPLMVTIPPFFTATITAHVPTMLAMAISPQVAVMVALGSGIGFTIKVNAIVGARAFTHAIFAFVGANAYKKGMSYKKVLLITAPIHGLCEALVVLPFGWDLKKAMLACGIGTIGHHLVDALVTFMVYEALIKTSLLKRPSNSI
ncbi:MAG: ECF transporter S component [Xylanivirga thermophila]|jgi:niacin transporter|uniref:ECF transporter S component n=1 Tax=Xylanivirga thermophila TaxID=2496273 RepID=UPI00101BB234|nr:ECF transporter S component [Xylanivirga thermophila]